MEANICTLLLPQISQSGRFPLKHPLPHLKLGQYRNVLLGPSRHMKAIILGSETYSLPAVLTLLTAAIITNLSLSCRWYQLLADLERGSGLERGSLTVRSVEAWHWVQTHWILRLGLGLKLEKIAKLFKTYGYCLQRELPRLHIRWVQFVGLST